MKYVDNSSGIEVPLNKRFDANDQPYYTGKLQFNGTLDLDGQVFMIFVSEEGYETLQISCLADGKVAKLVPNVEFGDRIKIDLEGFKDRDKNVYYIAKVKENRKIHMKNGIFFTIFLSEEGREELQITPLRQKRTYKKPEEHRKSA